MGFINYRIIIPILLFLVIAGVLYLDKTLPAGPDVSFYLDLSSLISRGDKFLIDFFDYRIPVFPLFFSPVYKIGLSDFQNRFIMLFGIYSLYCLFLYLISLSFTRSHLKSLIATLLIFFSMTSRQFDPDKNMSIPLFYHTLELISLFLLFKLTAGKSTSVSRKKIIFFSLLAGISYGVSFMGRQTQIALPLIVIGFFALLFHEKNGGDNFRNYWLVLFLFLTGFGASVIFIFHSFYVPGVHFLALAKKWLVEIPSTIYRVQPLRIVNKFITTLYWGLPEMRNINLPIFWATYVLSIASFSAFLFHESIDNIFQKIKNFCRENKEKIVFVFLTGFMAVATVLTTGSGAKTHESPFFTFYFFILVFILGKINFHRYLKNFGVVFLLVLFFMPNALDFSKKEIKIYFADWQNREVASFPDRIAEKIKPLIKPAETVVILGSYPTITRLVDYKPFMGNTNDIFLYSGQKFFGQNYQQDLIKNLDKVNVIYKLPDYPSLKSLSGIRENTSNEIYLYFEKYLKSKFEIASIIKMSGNQPEAKNEYGNYTDRAVVYIRKAK